MTNQYQLVGQDIRHGCRRLANGAFTKLASILPFGTPV